MIHRVPSTYFVYRRIHYYLVLCLTLNYLYHSSSTSKLTA